MPAKRVLIADDDFDLAQLLSMRCRQMGLEVFRSPDALHALLGSHRIEPDLVVLDVNMPAGNGLSVCEMMSGDRELSKVPVIIITGSPDEAIRQRCQQLGAKLVCKGPQFWEQLEPLICEVLGLEPAAAAPPQQPMVAEKPTLEAPAPSGRPRVLCVDDDPDISKAIKLRLEPMGIDVIRAFSGMQGYWFCLDSKPDLIITDLSMPDGEGSYLYRRLKQHPLTENIPVVVLTGQTNPAVKRQLLSVGVSDYLVKPLVFKDLLAVMSRYIKLPESPIPHRSASDACSA
jgi:DNA-binding response OmpR family regulator